MICPPVIAMRDPVAFWAYFAQTIVLAILLIIVLAGRPEKHRHLWKKWRQHHKRPRARSLW